MTDASSKIDVRRVEVGDLLLKILVHQYSLFSVGRIPVTRQQRHIERIQCV